MEAWPVPELVGGDKEGNVGRYCTEGLVLTSSGLDLLPVGRYVTGMYVQSSQLSKDRSPYAENLCVRGAMHCACTVYT